MQVKMHVEEHDTGHGKEMYTQVDSCYALGDCCANMELPLPALAQVGATPSQRLLSEHVICDTHFCLLCCSWIFTQRLLALINGKDSLTTTFLGWLRLQTGFIKP